MSELFLTNRTSREDPDCESEPGYLVSLSLVNLFTLVIGQPVNCRLLWTTFSCGGSSGSSRSCRSRDILNCNLALFHNFLYLVCVLHLIFLFSLRHHQSELLEVLLVYAQTGGPMSLAFICAERYVAVLHPTSYPLLKKYRCREVGAAAVWVSSLSIAMANTFIQTIISVLGGTVIKLVSFSVMLLATLVMVWCSLRIARGLRKSGPGQDKLHPLKKKALRTVCATLTINLLCYIPVAIMQKLKFLTPTTVQCTLAPVCILVLAAGSVVHPVFYLSTQGKMSTCCRGRRTDGPDGRAESRVRMFQFNTKQRPKIHD